MNKITLQSFITLITMALLLGAAPIQAHERGGHMMDDDDHGMMMRRGYGRGYGMMGGGMGMMHGGGMGMMGMGPVHMLDLNADQRKNINAIHDALRKNHWKTRGKMMDEHTKLRDLYAADSLDKKAITKVYDRIFSAKKKMIEQGIDAHNKVLGLLTKEQRKELRRYHHGRGMMHGGMGMHGGGMGMMH